MDVLFERLFWGALVLLLSSCTLLCSASERNSTLCDGLILRENMNEDLYSVDDKVYLNITCYPGYILYGSDGEIEQWRGVPCNSSNSSSVYIDAECKLSMCLNFTIGANMEAESYLVDNKEYLNLTCDVDHVLYGQNGEIELWKIVPCNLSSAGYWSIDVECRLIDCGEVAVGNNVQMDLSGKTTYGESKYFVCDSGYQFKTFRWGYIFCNSTGTWDLITPGEPFSCEATSKTIGCFEKDTLNSTTVLPIMSERTCINTCGDQDYRFAALTPDGCICSNALGNVTVIPSRHCNHTCSQTSQSHSMYCGGSNGEQSVYFTMIKESCYRNIQVNASYNFTVTGGNLQRTCTQLCYGADAYVAVYYRSTSQCLCSNQNYIEAVAIHDDTICQDSTVDDVATMKILAFSVTRRKSCRSLYSDDTIRTHGVYHLLDSDSVYCNFYDGTRCEPGWLGYAGSCYYFEYTQFSSFEINQKVCLQNNSSLVSILSADEHAFLNVAINTFEEFQTYLWYTGLTDPKSVSSFLWSDGNLQQFSSWQSVEPDTDDDTCAGLVDNGNYLADLPCIHSYKFICKKAKDQFRCIKTDVVPASPFVVVQESITMTSCSQICIGKQYVYALIRGIVCRCFMVLPTDYKELSLHKCDKTCTENDYQRCGGTAQYVYTVMKLDSYSKPQSCQDLEVAGISGIDAVLQSSTEPIYCNATVCPYSWVEGNSSCYKFSMGKKNIKKSVEYCAKYDAFLAVPSSDDEYLFLQNTIHAVSYYKSKPLWRIGIKATQSGSNVYRTSTGEKLPELFNVMTSNLYTYLNINESIGTTNSGVMSFICEKNDAYAGCYVLDNATPSVIKDDNYFMSVTQCVESCRANDFSYAMLTPTDCYCDNALPSNQSTNCESVCVGNSLQPCGNAKEVAGNVIVSVYTIDKYDTYSDCYDLYDAGVRHHGQYIVDSGQIYCNFYDNSTDCAQGWIGYKQECYKIGNSEHNRSDANAICTSLSGTIGTISNQDEHMFIKSLILGFETTALETISIGMDDWRQLSTFTLTSGKITQYLPNHSVQNIGNSGRMLQSTSNYESFVEYSPNTINKGVLCIGKGDYIGCFTKGTNLQQLISGSGTMDVTQCRQTCLGMRYYYAMAQQGNCFCGNETDVLQQIKVDDTNCNLTCYMSWEQRCGDDGHVAVYTIDSQEMATSCENLYQYGVMRGIGKYLINASGTVVETQCGFTDHTPCSVGWEGNSGVCYYIRNASYTTDNFQKASEYCIESGGYVFAPYQENQMSFLKALLGAYPGLSSFEDFYVGSYNGFLTSRFLSGDGHIVKINSSDFSTSNVSSNNLLFSPKTGHWEAAKGANTFIVCEKSQGYLGIFENPVTGTLKWSGSVEFMTVTACIQLCIGQNSSHSVLSDTQCSCYDDVKPDVMQQAKAFKTCPGYISQPCGSEVDNTVAIFNLEHYSDDVFESCDELYNYGVNKKGLYKIKPKDINDELYVNCFTNDELIDVLDTSTGGYTSTATSSLGNYTELNCGITLFVTTEYNAWIPQSTTNEYMEFIAPVDTLITGIKTQGLLSLTYDYWVESYSVKYKDSTGSWVELSSQYGSTIPANSDKHSVVTRFFGDPPVTSGIRIYPKTWNSLPALRIILLGISFQKFNHSESYLGCYVKLDNFFYGSNVTSNTECRNYCMMKQQPFYSFYESPLSCLCGDNVGTYGRYDDSLCKPAVQVNKHAFPVYRTYEKQCEPVTVKNSSVDSTFKHLDNIYTQMSIINFTCIEGYRFPDSSRSKSIECLQNNTWSAQLHDCYALNCSNLTAPVNGNIDIDDVIFGSKATVTCDTGYEQADDSTKTVMECTEPGVWNATFGDCSLINCGSPPDITRAVYTGSDFTYNQNITYNCYDSTWTEKNETSFQLRCSEYGIWEPNPPNCIYYQCPAPPYLSKGSYEKINSTHARYQCGKAYRMSSGVTDFLLGCNEDFVWDSLPAYCISNEDIMSQKKGTFYLVGKYVRTDTWNEISHNGVCVSFMDCANMCLRKIDCVSYTYIANYNTCKLYSTKGAQHVLQVDLLTKYFEITNVDYTLF